MTPPLRKKLLSPTEGPRPPRPPAPVRSEPPSSWDDAKVKIVLDAFRSFVSNSAKKHGVPAEEVHSLVKDHLLDPDG